MRRWLLLTIVTILVAGAVIYLNFDKIIIFSLSKIYNADISYKTLARNSDGGYKLENLKIMNKKMGVGFFSARAAIKPLWKANFLKSLDFDFKFKDTHFIKNKAEKTGSSYDTIEGIVSMPFEGRWAYKEISGIIEIFSNGLTLKNFNADGRYIKLFLSGDIYYNNTVDMDITMRFSKDALKDIPPELSSVVMRDEPENWKSFSVKLKGNYQSPAIQISGNAFRLNIGTIVTK